MKDVLADLDRWQSEGEEIALATLVRVRGSAPRAPGARLCVTRSGKMAGSVSGGCVENDVFARAMQVLDTHEAVVAKYGISDEMGFGVGLTCGGAIDVLIEPFVATDAWQAMRCAVERERPAAFGMGLTPPPLSGRQLALAGDGEVVGSIDAELDPQVIAAAQALLPDGGTSVLVLRWRGEEASIFVQAVPPPPHLIVVGATHTAISLCRLAKEMGFRVTIIDARGLFATRERFPDADTLLRARPDEVLDGIGLDAYTHLVVLTHDPKFDIPTLVRALRSQARYIGVMGSRATHARRAADLREEGFTDAELARISAPIGLDIGGRTPEEIALSIMAEIVAVRHGKDGKFLAHKAGAIHGGR